jgi:glutaredoxin 2
MADFANKRCPRCGKRPLDARLVQCPDCRVPFEYEAAPVPTLTPAQLAAVTKHVLGSWKLWLVLVAVVGAAIAGAVEFINVKAQAAREEAGREAQADADLSAAKIAEGISNQIVAQFQQPRIQSAIERVVTEKAGDILTNAVWASLDQFREKLQAANDQLAKTTNDLAVLSNNVHQAQLAAAQMAGAVSDDPALLTLVDRNVTRDGTNYDLTMFFRSTKNKPVGMVELTAGTYRQTAKIVNFTARNVDQVDPPIMNDIGDAAKLKFTVSHADAQVVVDLTLSAPTLVKVVGDELAEELTLPVAIDQMQLPMVNR